MYSKIFIFFTAFIILSVFSFFYILIQVSENDTCLDIGLCREGLTVNTVYGMVEINKNSCEKYNWKWFEETNTCLIK